MMDETESERDLLQCQKRPTTASKKTYYSVIRDVLVSKETYYSVKRGDLQCQKRPTTKPPSEDMMNENESEPEPDEKVEAWLAKVAKVYAPLNATAAQTASVPSVQVSFDTVGGLF